MANTTSVAFGSGILIATPSAANATPRQFGTLQDVSLDITFSKKNLYGMSQVAVAIARGECKITGKAKYANIDGPMLDQCFFNTTATGGQKLWSYNEGASVPASSPYTYSCANATNFDADLGVVFVSTGVALTKVASAPTTGQYSVAAGVYTFAAADTGRAFLVSYSYTQLASGSGTRRTFSNQLMGVAPTFQIDFYDINPNISGAQWSLRLYSCVADKLSVASKNSDFTIPELDFEAMANAAGLVLDLNTAV